MALWTPDEITTTLWFDADDATTITEISGGVSQWDDKSGNGHDASTPFASNRPVYNTSFNGKKALVNDGSNDGFNTIAGNIGIAAGDDRHVFAVMYCRDQANSQLCGVDGGNTLDFGTFDRDERLRARDSGVQYYSDANTVPYNQYIQMSVFGKTSEITLYVNGTQEATSATSAFRYAIGATYLLMKSTTSSRCFNGGLSEFILLASDPSTEDRQRIEGYLAWKWGLEANLPSGHPYENAAPTIGGIEVLRRRIEGY